MKPKLLFLSVIFNFAVCTVMSQTTGYLEGPLESCPVNSSLNTYTVKDLPAGCKYSWTVDKGSIYDGATNKGTTFPASSKLAIDVKWNEESYINDIVAGYNNGHYPVGLVKVVTVGCSDPINNNKFPKDLPVTITSVKGYQIPGITFMGAMRIPNETIDLTTNTSAVIVNCGSLPINYPPTPLGFIRTVYPTGFHWTLPEGWTAAGQSSTSFDAGSYLTLTPPCWGYSLNTLKDLKVKIITPEVCLVNNAYQQGNDFVLKVKKDAPYVMSLSPTTINWGITKSYTVTATTNISNGLQYIWNLPAGFTRTSTGSSGQIITTTPSLDVTTTGCNTSEQVSLKVQNSCGTSIIKTQAITFIYPEISGISVVCSSGTTFTVDNLPSGASLLWIPCYSLNLLSYSGNNATFASNGMSPYIGNIQVQITLSCGSTYTALKYINAGSPRPGQISIDFDAPPRRFTASIESVSGASYYNWYIDGVQVYNSGTVAIFPRDGDCDHVYYVDVASVNECGESERSSTGVPEDPCYYFSIFPNPASDNIAVTISKEKTASLLKDNIKSSANLTSDDISMNTYTIRILDGFGMSIISLKKVGNAFSIPIRNLKNGIYIVEANDGKKIYQQQLIVQH